MSDKKYFTPTSLKTFARDRLVVRAMISQTNPEHDPKVAVRVLSCVHDIVLVRVHFGPHNFYGERIRINADVASYREICERTIRWLMFYELDGDCDLETAKTSFLREEVQALACWSASRNFAPASATAVQLLPHYGALYAALGLQGWVANGDDRKYQNALTDRLGGFIHNIVQDAARSAGALSA